MNAPAAGKYPGGKPQISTWRRESLRQRDGFNWRIDELSEAILAAGWPQGQTSWKESRWRPSYAMRAIREGNAGARDPASHQKIAGPAHASRTIALTA
jgi:hypothetical protein